MTTVNERVGSLQFISRQNFLYFREVSTSSLVSSGYLLSLASSCSFVYYCCCFLFGEGLSFLSPFVADPS